MRTEELAAKRERLFSWMDARGFKAVYLTRVANFAWLTAGSEPVIMLSSDRAEAGLWVTREKALVVCNTIEGPRLLEEERLDQQGYDFYTYPWYKGMPDLAKLAGREPWASDWPLGMGEMEAAGEIARLRFELTPDEGERYRWLGMHAAQALEHAARNIKPGMTEMEIAGLVGSEARRQSITATLLLVGTDERIFHYRHPIPTGKSLERYAMLVICGRRWGLVASATRFVHFGPLPAELETKQRACAFVDATYNAATRVGAKVARIVNLAVRAYANVGYPDEWQKHNQGGAAGYESRDYDGTLDTYEIVQPEQGFAWNPSITGVKSEDTAIVHTGGLEFITVTGEWPSLSVEVDGQEWQRPAILIL